MRSLLLRLGFRERILKYTLRLISSPQRDQRLCFSLVRHEGKPRIYISIRKPNGSFEELERLSMTVHFFETNSH